MAAKTIPYKFNDGRGGFYTKSNKVYKTIEIETPIETKDENGEIKIEFVKEQKDIYYKIRKIGTDEVYDEAIDIIEHKYEDVTEAEMEAEYGSNK